MEWSKQTYNKKYEEWMPWIEDLYLRWFTKDNKVSYTTKDTLDKSKVTGIDQVDTLQDGVNNVVAGQVGKGGLLQPVGDMASKEGMNRAERQGKDDKGGYMPTSVPGGESINNGASSVMEGGKNMASKTGEGIMNAPSAVGGMFSSGNKDGKDEQQQKK